MEKKKLEKQKSSTEKNSENKVKENKKKFTPSKKPKLRKINLTNIRSEIIQPGSTKFEKNPKSKTEKSEGAPNLGQHTKEIMKIFDYDDEQIDDFYNRM